MPKPKSKNSESVSGVMLYAKAPGLTSFSSLWSIKHALGTGKVGHTGTLDSFAEGLLVVLSGNLTHLVPHITSFKKTYQAVVCFGVETDTLDPGGRIIGKGDAPDRESIERALEKFKGAVLQVPPVYSALHVDGKRASDAVRDGHQVKLEPRQVFIYGNRLLDYRPADENDPCSYALIEVTCSKGTYIRALARDIASELGSVAHLSALRRTRVGPFSLEDAACYGSLSEFTIENGIRNDRFFAELRDNPPPLPTERKKVTDSEETVNDIRSHLLKFTESLAFTCGLKVDELKPEFERPFNNGRPLHGSMFRRIVKPEEVETSEYDFENEIAVFYEDGSFAGMIVKGDFRLSYGFVVPRQIEKKSVSDCGDGSKKKSAMRVFSWKQISEGEFPSEWRKRGTSLAVGSFDGMHLGHRALVDAVLLGKKEGLVTGLVTFNAPYRSFSGSWGGDVLTLRQKIREMESLGLDFAVVIDFSPEFVKMDGHSFISSLVDFCGMKAISEGRDFRCGYKGSMDMDKMESLGKESGFTVRKLCDVIYRGERVSSSRIRTSVAEGDFSSAEGMLGRNFVYDLCGASIDRLSEGRYSVSLVEGGQVFPRDGSFSVSLILDGGSEIPAECRIFRDENAVRRLEFNLLGDMIGCVPPELSFDGMVFKA